MVKRIPLLIAIVSVFIWVFLMPKKPAVVDRDHFTTAGQVDRHSFALTAGYTYKITVEQCGIDLEPRAISPRGETFQMDRNVGAFGPEFIWIFPDQDEQWTIEVLAHGENHEEVGNYRIAIEEQHPRQPFDQELARIQSLWQIHGTDVMSAKDPRQVEEIYGEIVSFYLEIGERQLAADYLVELAWALLPHNKFQLGLDYANLAKEIDAALGYDYGLINANYISGHMQWYLYELTRDHHFAMGSLRDFNQSLYYSRKIKFWQHEIVPISYFCKVLERAGLYEESLAESERVASSSHHNANNKNYIALLLHLGSMYDEVFNDKKKAVHYAGAAEQGLSRIEEKPTLARDLNQIGEIYANAGLYARAAEVLDKALAHCKRRELHDNILLHQAMIYHALDRDAEAMDKLKQIQPLPENLFMGKVYLTMAEIERKSDPQAAKLLYLKADGAFTERDLEAPFPLLALSQMASDLAEKAALLRRAMVKAEALRSLYSDQNLRVGVFSRYFDLYASAIQNLMEQNHQGQAPAVAQAFVLLEHVCDKSLRESTLLGINKSRREIDLEALYRQDPAEWQALERQLTRKVVRVEDRASTMAEIRRQLGPETLLMATLLLPEKSYIWFVWADGYRAITTSSATDLEHLVESFRKDIEQARVDHPRHSQSGRRLFEALFPKDLPLHSFKRLALVTDDALTLLPFAALPTRNDHLLVEDLDLVYLPTASHISSATKTTRPPATRPLAVFANPVFSPTDSRMEKTMSEAQTERLLRSFSGRKWLSRLGGSEAEAKAILELPALRDQAYQAYFGFQATRQAAMDPTLGRFRILHFATHCDIDMNDAAKSKLVLSRYDAEGRELANELTLADISDMKLSAELVVLSACETAIGRRVRGAGPMSMARGFMMAGAERVAATLWPIHDKPSAALMKHFYTAMLEQKQSSASALNLAQRQMLRDPQWHHPKYWSAFVLLGNRQ